MTDQDYYIQRTQAQYHLFKNNKPLLGHLDIELTERCNNACMHCYINLPVEDKNAAGRELTTEQWKDILKQAAELGALSIRFTGGEPLLREDFAELFLYARHLGMKVLLFTNARLITPSLAELFSQVPPLKVIEISVYGMHAETYDAVTCVRGAFNEFRRGVDLLLEKKIPFIIKSVMLPPNLKEIDEFETWTAMIPWMDKNPSYAMFLDLRTRRDSPTKNQLIKKLRLTPEEGISLLTRNESIYRRSMAQYCAKFMGPQGDKLFSCGAGEAGCVDAYGTYQMCMLLRHPDTVYDLKKGSLREALTDVFPRFRELRATNPEYLKRCSRCFLHGLCEQCPAHSWSEHGTLDTPVEYLCQVAHAQARYLGLLSEGELGWEVTDWKTRVNELSQKYASEPVLISDSSRKLSSNR